MFDGMVLARRWTSWNVPRPCDANPMRGLHGLNQSWRKLSGLWRTVGRARGLGGRCHVESQLHSISTRWYGMSERLRNVPVPDDVVLAMDAWETEQWFTDDQYGHAIPKELWSEWEGHWKRIEELTEQFSKCPFIDNRPPRTGPIPYWERAIVEQARAGLAFLSGPVNIDWSEAIPGVRKPQVTGVIDEPETL